MKKSHQSRMNIAMRIALLSWLVALATLFLFVVVTIPQQKQVLLKNLESKANGLAVSLHDVAAGAAINEDYASVVSAAQTLLAGDPDLDFLIVMKNDGFSLVVEQNSWRVEESASSFWLSKERKSQGAIEVVPIFDRRVFHFAQPFDYSGIQWGWIHVGLSLDGYDQSVDGLYRNTVYLALCCIAFSLLVSLLYARRMMQPVVRLRSVVQQIAEGDLSVRAETRRRDEIGSLAESVNTMTEALLRRDQILESVRFAAQQFLRTAHWQDAIKDVLSRICLAAGATKAAVYKNYEDREGQICAIRQYEWVLAEAKIEDFSSDLQDICFADFGLSHWVDVLGNNVSIALSFDDMSFREREVFAPHHIRAIIAISIFVEDKWWGTLTLQDCFADRKWTDAEKDSLRTGADMLGATIARQQVQEALLEAKATLEERVAERTRELQDQVVAKEQALADLASAQSSMVEMSRYAGMAEVATGVLHNVGNVLNSINVSCNLLMDQLRDSRIGNVARVAELIDTPGEDLARFLTEDGRGKQIPHYLSSLATALQEEHSVIFKEAESLGNRIEHVKEIVAMQQNYGRVLGIKETIEPEQLMEDALTLNAGALARHHITVRKEYQQVPVVVVDKHMVLQILLNLMNNAKYACSDSTREKKKITLKVYNRQEGIVCLEVSDNGMGIHPDNLTKIFQHGFTTRSSGHGFGLHSGALAAHELGGSLTAHSDGPGMGATFFLEIPTLVGGQQ